LFRCGIWSSRRDFTDLTIRLGKAGHEEEVRAHKIILASASSPLLREELKTKSILHLPDVSKEDFLLFLDFLYSGKAKVPKEKEEALIAIGNRLNIIPLLDAINNRRKNRDPIRSRFCDREKLDAINHFRRMKVSDEQRSTISINDLPNELLVKIFSNISTFGLLLNVALVSKRFYELTKNPEVHRVVTLKLTGHQLWKQSAENFLKTAIQLKELHIKRNGTWDSEDYSPLSTSLPEICVMDDVILATLQHPHLKVIDICLTAGAVSVNCISKLRRAEWWTKLTKITLKIETNKKDTTLKLDEEEVTTALQTLGKAGNLKCLNADIPERIYSEIALFSKNLEIMKRIPAIKHEAWKKIVQEKKDKLRELEICSDFSPQDLKLILKFENLTAMAIHSRTFNSFEILPQLKHLQSLELRLCRNPIVEIGRPAFKDSLPPRCLRRLQSLQLVSTTTENIPPGVFEAFAKACPNLRNLKVEDQCKKPRFTMSANYQFETILCHFIDSCSILERLILATRFKFEVRNWLLCRISSKLPLIRLVHLGYFTAPYSHI